MSLNCELGGLKVLTFVTRYEFCNLLGLKVCPAALGGSWFYAPFEGVTVKPPALPVVLDYGKDPDKGVIFHCSNLPKAVFADMKMDYQEIIAGTVGKENTYGTVVGRIKSGPFTYCRVSTDDSRGVIRVYVGEGELTDDPLETFGGYGVVHIPNFQGLLHHICENGFEHHVAINLSQTASALNEALGKYLGWDVYYHGANDA